MQKSTSANGRRIAAAMFLGATSAAMAAGTAHADGVAGAKFDTTGPGGHIQMSGDHRDGSNAVLIGLSAPGSSHDLWTYCIQKTVELNEHETYDEHAWSEEQNRTGIDQRHLEGIKWILNNSYPQLDLGALATSSGVAGLTDNEAVEGTQAAIWNLSDASGKTTLDAKKESDAKVVALYNYLVSTAATHMNDSGQPQASLTIAPVQTGAVHPGDKVGFKLNSPNTNGAFITVSLADASKSGAKLVDTNGKAVAANAMFKSGDVVYVQVPASVPAGSIKLVASGTVTGLETGRVFVSADGKASQNLILAQAQSTPVSATAALQWTAAPSTPVTPTSSPSTAPSSHPSTPPSTVPSTTPSVTPSSPTGGLAHTGAGDTAPLAGGALALVAAGGGMVVYTRRTRKQGSHL
jgi:TQXA domain-containing protein